MEIFKQIEGYPQYVISSKGRVFKGDKELRQGCNKRGYCHVYLRKDGRDYPFYVHLLVAQAFLYKYHASLVVNHIDENPRNNEVSNLEYVTQKENVHHGTGTKRMKASKDKHHLGVVASEDRKTYDSRYGRLLMRNKLTGEVAKCSTVHGRVYVLKTTTMNQWEFIDHVLLQ